MAYDSETGVWAIETPSPVLPMTFILPSGNIVPITWFSEQGQSTRRPLAPLEAPQLIINALQILGLLKRIVYDSDTDIWVIENLSPTLPIAFLLPNGDIVPITWFLEE